MKEIRKLYLFTVFRSFVVYASITIAFYQANGLDYTSIMTLQSVYAVSIMLLEIPSGMFSDMLGRKKTLVIGTVGFVIAYIFGALGHSFWMFLLMQIFAALGQSFYSGTFLSLMIEDLKAAHMEDKQSKVYANMQKANLLSMLAASGFSVLIVKYISMRCTYICTLIAYVLTLIVAISLCEQKEQSESANKVSFKGYKELIKMSMSLFVKCRELRIVFVDMLILTVVATCIINLQQAMYLLTELPIKYFGFLSMLMTVTGVLALHNIDSVEKVFKSKRNFNYYSIGIIALVLGINVFIRNQLLLIASFVVFIVLYRVRDVFVTVEVNRYIENENRATVLSIISAVEMIFLAVLQPLVGWIADRSVQIALGSVLLLMLVAYGVLGGYKKLVAAKQYRFRKEA